MIKLLSYSRPFVLQPLGFYIANKIFARHNFFLSFSDALLCIFNRLNIKSQRGHILVPNFFCPDTLKFVSKYLRIVFYKINNDFSVDKDSYFNQIKKFKPKVIINYSFIGFSLSERERLKLKEIIDERTVIIDDFAHGLLGQEKINFICSNHFYIDSIRKHSPFLGSHLVGRNFKHQAGSVKRLNYYKIKLTMLQIVKGLVSFLAYIFNSNRLYRLYDKIFIFQDKLFSPGGVPISGFISTYYLYNFINSDKLKQHQNKLIKSYTFYFNKLNIKSIGVLEEKIINSARMSYYPLFVNEADQEPLINFLKKRNIFVEKLWQPEGLNYSELKIELYKSFLIFPLTWLIKEKDTETIAEAVADYFRN